MHEDTYHLGIKALIVNTDHKILLLQLDPQAMGGEVWDIPGGRVQRGHSIEATLQREVEEETGVHDVTMGEHIGMVLSPIRIPLRDGDVGLVLSVYACEIPADAVIRPADGHVAFEWAMPTVAAQRLSNKYPPEFCQLIANRL